MPHAIPDERTPVEETSPALSARSLRNLRHVRTLHSMRRNTSIAVAVFALLLGGGYAVPAFAHAPQAAAPKSSQTLTVSAVAVHAATNRDDYSLTEPPPLQWPVNPNSRIADGFGPRVSPCAGCSSFHEGVDFDAGYGAQVHSIAAGVVVETHNPFSSALGVHVTIQHLIAGQAIKTVYGHMQTGSMHLHVGETVTAGQVIGLVGSTGASTGAHLHFEVHVGNRAVNPLTWMRARLG